MWYTKRSHDSNCFRQVLYVSVHWSRVDNNIVTTETAVILCNELMLIILYYYYYN